MSACTSGVSRRSFVQGAGLAAAGAAALAGGALPQQARAMNVNPDDIAWDYEADVVVLGFGVAGATTATTVERAGSSVIVVERDEFDSRLSNTRMSGGLIHCPDADHDPEALKQYLRCMFSGDILPGMTEGEYSPLFIEGMVEKFAALEPGLLDFVTSLDDDIMFGMFGGAAFPTFPGAEGSCYRVYAPKYNEAGLPVHGNDLDKYDVSWGEGLMRAFENELIDNELVQFLWGHYGERLIQTPEGEVIGLVALKGGPDGEPVYIKAKKAVMLSSGGYEYSEELRRAFIEGPAVTGWTFYGTPSNTGQGIVMGLEAGAQMLKKPRRPPSRRTPRRAKALGTRRAPRARATPRTLRPPRMTSVRPPLRPTLPCTRPTWALTASLATMTPEASKRPTMPRSSTAVKRRVVSRKPRCRRSSARGVMTGRRLRGLRPTTRAWLIRTALR